MARLKGALRIKDLEQTERLLNAELRKIRLKYRLRIEQIKRARMKFVRREMGKMFKRVKGKEARRREMRRIWRIAKKKYPVK